MEVMGKLGFEKNPSIETVRQSSFGNQLQSGLSSIFQWTSDKRSFVLVGEFEVQHMGFHVSLIRNEDQRVVYKEPSGMSHTVRVEKVLEGSNG